MPRSFLSDTKVLKFGGSTFRTLEDFRRIAGYLRSRFGNEQCKLVVVVSGQAGFTEELRRQAKCVSSEPSAEATDALLTLSDTHCMALLRLAVEDQGLRTATLNGFQLGIRTDSCFSHARILEVRLDPVIRALARSDVVIVSGGQGVDAFERPTWFGKNSSDLTAVALAGRLELPRCEVYSDVCGFYSADPNLIPDARLFETIPYGLALDLASSGAKVIHHGAIRHAKRHGVRIVCRENYDPYRFGTLVGAGEFRPAVVVDCRSIVLEFSGRNPRVKAENAIKNANVPAIDLEDATGRRLVLTGVFFDEGDFLKRNGIEASVAPGKLVSEWRSDGSVQRFVVESSEAVGLGRVLHSRLYRPERPFQSSS